MMESLVRVLKVSGKWRIIVQDSSTVYVYGLKRVTKLKKNRTMRFGRHSAGARKFFYGNDVGLPVVARHFRPFRLMQVTATYLD